MKAPPSRPAGFGDFEARSEEGVNLSAYTLEVTAWLQHCLDELEAGREPLGDPWWPPAGMAMLTDEEVDAAVEKIEEEYVHELGTYPGYHRNRSGANALPEFTRLNSRGRRALVEGLQQILVKHEGWREPEKLPDEWREEAGAAE